MAFHQRRDVTVFRATNEIAFPMAGDGAVLDFCGPFPDGDGVYDLTARVFKDTRVLRAAYAALGSHVPDQLFLQHSAGEAGKIILEQKVPTTPEAMKQTFSRIPQSRIALETGTHSPWVSRLLTELGHEVIVAHAQKVQLITKSNRKDDRHDARTLARLARIDPELLGPIRHRSVQAQIHLTVIRARAELVSAHLRTAKALQPFSESPLAQGNSLRFHRALGHL
jgi:hypothetical protein